MQEETLFGKKENEENIKAGQKTERSFKTELALFLILGFLLGIMLKTEAIKRITIGFDDYRVVTGKQSGYNINQIQDDLRAKREEEMKINDENVKKEEGQSEPSAVNSGSCGA